MDKGFNFKEFDIEHEYIQYDIDSFNRDFEILKSYLVGCIYDSIKIVDSNKYCIDLVFIIPPFTKRILHVQINGITSRSVMGIHKIFYRMEREKYIENNIYNTKKEICKILDNRLKMSFSNHIYNCCISENTLTSILNECKYITRDFSYVYCNFKISIETVKETIGYTLDSHDKIVILDNYSDIEEFITSTYDEFKNIVNIKLNMIPIYDIIRNNIKPYSLYLSLDHVDIRNNINYRTIIFTYELISIPDLNRIIDNIRTKILTDENLFNFCMNKLIGINMRYNQGYTKDRIKEIVNDQSTSPSEKSDKLNALYLDTYDFGYYEDLFLETKSIEYVDSETCIVACISKYNSDIIPNDEFVRLIEYRKYPPRSVFMDFIKDSRKKGIDANTYEWGYCGFSIYHDRTIDKIIVGFNYKYIKPDFKNLCSDRVDQKRYYREWW